MSEPQPVFVIVDKVSFTPIRSVHLTLDSAKQRVVEMLNLVGAEDYDQDHVWYDWGLEHVFLHDLRRDNRYRIYEAELLGDKL